MSVSWNSIKLKSNNRAKRQAALEALRRLRAADTLCRAVDSPFADVADGAALSLASIGDERAIDALCKRGESSQNTQILDALGKFSNDRVLTTLSRAVLYQNEEYALAACRTIAKMLEGGRLVEMNGTVLDNFELSLRNCPSSIQSAVARLLRNLHSLNDKLLTALRSCAKSRDDPVREQALHTLVQFDGQLAHEVLYGILFDVSESPTVRRLALTLLRRRLAWEPHTFHERLHCILLTGNLDEAVDLGPEAVEPIICSIDSGTPGAVDKVNSFVGLFKSVDAVPTLTRLLYHTKYGPLYGSGIATALASVRPEGVAALLSIAADTNVPAKSRATAIETLGNTKAIAALDLLIVLLADSTYQLAAIRALGQIADGRALQPLIDVSQSANVYQIPDLDDALARILEQRASGKLPDRQLRAIEALEGKPIPFHIEAGCDVRFPPQFADFVKSRQLARQLLRKRNV